METVQSSAPLWSPSPAFRENSNLMAFMRWLSVTHDLPVKDYDSLWTWSVEHPQEFWEMFWSYIPVQAHSPYRKVWDQERMPGTSWFPGSTLNYAEHLLKGAVPGQPAILFQSERHALREIQWSEVRHKVAALQQHFRQQGLASGDRVVAFLPNIPEATICLMACASMGLVWSSCSPDFGAGSVIERFAQIEPKVLITVDGYQYNGQVFAKEQVILEMTSQLPTLQEIVFIPYLDDQAKLNAPVPVSY